MEETAKFGDASVRSSLRSALVESAFATAIANALRAPKEAFDNNDQLSSLLPDDIRKAIIDTPADLPRLVDELLFPTVEDERMLTTAKELREVIGIRLENNSIRSELANNLSDGASIIPSTPDLSAIRSLVSDADTRDFIMEQLPGVGALGRRLGAGLLRRAAYRAQNSPILPEEARSRLADANNRLADVIAPETVDSAEQ